ncbi:Hsp20/alpha crystallin family protein [Zeaxanthinibacter sp. PT1]|uniref:Hsp20/alpha crystallin family protein n=1 Tax=Zeaxanthinibacter TaxID=561554 RepID=UPI0023496830|nr:Hsp20/alpha crystallin family protein [Zeaxanthinibacter sp. PT1]MDC6352009.1 Hsp20/alpha crystallin family protein [Zeaxanthinibacter sp. PT1]
MTLIKSRKRPIGQFLSQELFDIDDFFESQWKRRKMFSDEFWNGKSGEPAMNIRETDGKFEVEMSAPGFDKKDFEVTLDEGYLHIKAEKTISEEEEEDNYTRREFSYNSFERSLKLPESVKEVPVEANYKNGILHFELVKKEASAKKEPIKIAIN